MTMRLLQFLATALSRLLWVARSLTYDFPVGGIIDNLLVKLVGVCPIACLVFRDCRQG